tara:strand:+ start:82 stop:405 length:324 start_codon:yes stop_codon:yes gene_type:complete
MRLLNFLIITSISSSYVLDNVVIHRNIKPINNLYNIVNENNSTINNKPTGDYLTRITLFDCIYTIIFGPRMSFEEYEKKIKDRAIKDIVKLSILIMFLCYMYDNVHV